MMKLIFLPFCLILLTVQTPSFALENNFVNVLDVDPNIRVDLMYASSDNFLGRPVAGYQANVCYLREEAAQALKKANERLRSKGKANGKNLVLWLRDCYRPEKAVKDFIDWTKDPLHTETKNTFYPDLSKEDLVRLNYIAPISGHSRGFSVDLTLAELGPNGTLKELSMGTRVDFFGERSHTNFAALSKEEKENRQLLLEVMSPDFKNYSKEWWHFVLKNEPLPGKSYDFDIASAKDEIFTHVDDPKVLGELDPETHGPLSLVSLFKILHSENQLLVPQIDAQAQSTGNILDQLKETYGNFVFVLSADLSRIVDEIGIDWEKDITKTYQPSAAKTEAGKIFRQNGNVMRVFNEKWLNSSDGQFVLAGIVNRMDRKDFEKEDCGEVRFIYRLSYALNMGEQTYASRMPFTINMVFRYKNDGKNCSEVASLWKASHALSAKEFLEGPLNFSRLNFKQMEVNAQIARFPSDLENDERRNFAGQAIYWMRIFAVSEGRMQPQKLENTPDVTAILKDKSKQELLKLFITSNLRQIDQGVFRLPAELLTDLALTYSTLGSNRIANKPFNLLLNDNQAQEILDQHPELPNLQFLASGKSVLERLNTSSCMGCHQASSTAGFHFLGKDRSDFGKYPAAIQSALDGNRLQIPFSPHFNAEIFRRKAYLEKLANGDSPDPFRPHPSAPPAKWGGDSFQFQDAKANMPCWKDGVLASPANWTCDKNENLSCETLVKNSSLGESIGQCVPSSKEIYSGLSCRKNDLEDHTAEFTDESFDSKKSPIAYNLTSFQDKVTKDEQLYKLSEGKLDASALNCRPTRIGVPLGRVTRACTTAERSLENLKTEKTPKEFCAVVGGKGFEEMAKGYFDSRKFAAGVGRGMLNTCDIDNPCREDYICQEMPDFLSGARFGVKKETLENLHEAQVGFCTPTYFIYQLRLDGHPNPK